MVKRHDTKQRQRTANINMQNTGNDNKSIDCNKNKESKHVIYI